MNSDSPLIVILGPTASGKTAVAIQLAHQLQGEIICADSRTVYREMNIGTAKPTIKEQDGVPHWGLDLANPDERFTLYDFQQYVNKKIVQIRERGHVPMLVGGSGLYIDAVIYSYRLGGEHYDAAERSRLKVLSIDELKNVFNERHLELPRDSQNKRRLIRAIEQGRVNRDREPLLPNTLVYGIQSDLATLRRRIELRSEAMLNEGLIEEVKYLDQKYGDVEPLRRNLYGVIKQYLRGELTDDDLIPAMVRVDYQLARKQLTWWRSSKRAGDIHWLALDKVVPTILDTVAR